MISLSGQVVLITGASRGLGRHTALKLSEAGMRVAVCARNKADLRGVVGEIEAAGGTALACPLDVREAGQIDANVARVLEAFGGIDVLINNAGLGWYKPFTEHTRDEIDTTPAVNLTGLIHMTHAVLPHMLAAGRGYIINIASDIGRRVIPNMAAYVAAKHGVVGFSGSLLREVKDRGIKVSVLLPGIIDTYFAEAEEGSRDPSWSMQPADVAGVIHSLLTSPANMLLDEVTLHPLGQDF